MPMHLTVTKENKILLGVECDRVHNVAGDTFITFTNLEDSVKYSKVYHLLVGIPPRLTMVNIDRVFSMLQPSPTYNFELLSTAF